MRAPLTYIVVDIETNGPVAGRHAMLNLSAVALDQDCTEHAAFSENVLPVEGSTSDPDTLAWWMGFNADVYKQITSNARPAVQVMQHFDAFVRSFSGRRVFVAHPLIFDGVWVSYYLERFLGQGVMANHGTVDPLFYGAGIDLPSFMAGALGVDSRFERQGRYPSEVATNLPHTHHGLVDVRGHADVLRNTLNLLEEMQR